MTGAMWRKAVATASLAALLGWGTPAGAQTYSDGYKFLQAVEKRDRNELDALIAKNHTVVNSRDLSNGHTGLHIAVERRDIGWVAYLLTQGANPNVADNRGVTPLMRAAQIGFVEGVETLVASRARVDEPSDTGETPLITAVHRRDTAMMRILLRAGADPDRTDNSGRSARDYAGLQGRASTTMAEIERTAEEADGRRRSAEVYGPSF